MRPLVSPVARYIYSFNRQCSRRPPRLVNTACTVCVSTTIVRSDESPTSVCTAGVAGAAAAADCAADADAGAFVAPGAVAADDFVAAVAVVFGGGGGGGAKNVW